MKAHWLISSRAGLHTQGWASCPFRSVEKPACSRQWQQLCPSAPLHTGGWWCQQERKMPAFQPANLTAHSPYNLLPFINWNKTKIISWGIFRTALAQLYSPWCVRTLKVAFWSRQQAANRAIYILYWAFFKEMLLSCHTTGSRHLQVNAKRMVHFLLDGLPLYVVAAPISVNHILSLELRQICLSTCDSFPSCESYSGWCFFSPLWKKDAFPGVWMLKGNYRSFVLFCKHYVCLRRHVFFNYSKKNY